MRSEGDRRALHRAAAVSIVGIVLVTVGLSQQPFSLELAALGLLLMLVAYLLAIVARRS